MSAPEAGRWCSTASALLIKYSKSCEIPGTSMGSEVGGDEVLTALLACIVTGPTG